MFICFMVVDWLILLVFFPIVLIVLIVVFVVFFSFLILFSCCFSLGLLLLFDAALYCALRISQEAILQEKQANDSLYP